MFKKTETGQAFSLWHAITLVTLVMMILTTLRAISNRHALERIIERCPCAAAAVKNPPATDSAMRTDTTK